MTESTNNLSAKRQRLLELRLKEKRASSETQTIPRRKGLDPAPLSFTQQRLWFLDQLEPGGIHYSIPVGLRLKGHLDATVLQKCLNQVVQRHEALRTHFEVVEGQPRQVIEPVVALEIPLADVGNFPEAQQEVEALRLCAEEVQRPFDLEHGPVMRAKLIRLGKEEHILLLVMHHIASDGWSVGVLIREVESLYQAFREGKPSPLPELPVQYADFAAWQREWLQGKGLEEQLGYWKKQLEGSPALLDLPTDRPRPATQSYRGATIPLDLPKPLLAGLKELSRREGATLFMTLLAGFQTLLHRYTNSDDILVGSPLAGRNRTEIEPLIGFFVNTHVLRGDLSGNPSFRTLLGRTRETALGAYAHQDLPFERLVEELRPERNLSYSPLFQVMFVLQNALWETARLADLEVTQMRIDNGTSKLDLTLYAGEHDDALQAVMEYNTDLFEAETIRRMLGHYQKLLEGIVANPDQRLSDLPMLTETERQQLLVEWNRTEVDYPRDQCLHRLIEEQVQRTPEATAVIFADKQLTYRQLNERANQLARHLQGLGVGPDTLVGICVERSLEMVVGLLGILKAGGAYVPLDPEYPKDRLAFMLADAGAPALLTHSGLQGSLPAHSGKVVLLDVDWPQIAKESTGNVSSSVTAEHLAYMIYTSGSTGRPKGAMNTHVAIVNRLLWMQDAYLLTPSDRVLQKTPFSFDVSVWEFFWPLLTGAKLVVARPGSHKDGAYLANLISREKITTLHFVPSMLSAFLEEGGLESSCVSLKRVICSGEALPFELQQRFFSILPTELHNLYGPTEAAVDVTYWACERDSLLRTVPIGRPIANTQIRILDQYLQPTPVGVPGELHIGGIGLARGYHNRPELTAEKFIPDPFRTEHGARLYKTGDLARYLPNGAIEYLGRLDHQVKIRGFRIELGEIESALAGLPGVRGAVVMAREDVPGDKRLVAYLTTNSGEPPKVSELRGLLQAKLPEYMVPSAFVTLDRFPLTPNGKVNRKALPMPDLARAGLEKAFVAPRTPIEQVVAGVWSQILRLKQVSVHDNFFEMGGHSLLATQVISRVRHAFGVDLPLHSLFEAPTVEGMALALLRLSTNHAELEKRSELLLKVAELSESEIDARLGAGSNIKFGPDSKRRALFEKLLQEEKAGSSSTIPRRATAGAATLSFAQERLWFLDQLEPDSAVYNIPLGLRLGGALNVSVLQRCLSEILRRHEPLRTRFEAVEGQPVQVIQPVAPLEMPLVDLRGLPEREAEARRLCIQEFQRPFDLARDFLLRAKLYQLGETEHILFLNMHHIASDGWSIGLLVSELRALYEAFVGGKPSPLPELSIQYADFAVWQREWLQGEALEKQLSYWKKLLEGAPALLNLPTDRPRPATQSYRGALMPWELPKPLSVALGELSRREGATLFMTLLAGFQTLLHRYTSSEDIMVGSPIAGRNRTEIEPLIGFFINTLVLRGDLSGNPSFRTLLGRTREAALGAYAHQDLPFERLVEELHLGRDMSHPPLFQVMFVLQNAPLEALQLAGMEVTPIPLDSGTSKFDLTLGVEQRGGALQVVVEYNTDLFEAKTIGRMLGHYQGLLEGIVANPEQRLLDLPLLASAERQKLLVDFNRTEIDYPRNRCLHELVEEQVERAPEAVAVVFEDKQLTYRQLNERANQLARHLQGLGVGPDTLVGIFVGRSLDMIVGLLGILKAGGAYVPLDPEYPKERLAFMLEDAGVGVLLTQAHLTALLPSYQARIVRLDADWPVIAGESVSNVTSAVKAEHLAYMIYTSGSTGRPKGTTIPHRGVLRLLCGTDFARLDQSRIFLQLAPISFDASTLEIWGPLLHGAKCVVFPGRVPSPEELGWVIKEHRITTLWLTSSLFNEVIDQAPQALSSLNELLIGGEALSIAHVRRGLELLPETQIINGYGPTESTTFTCCYRIPRELPPKLASIPIGRPIANTRVYILDERHNPAPVGVAGELYIGGDGLARGYLNQPELTAKKFIPDPFSKEPGARLYRTGDLARYLSDGNIEFLGRLDNQVKIRGFRIELGEIESVLAGLPGMREAVVVAREDVPGDKRLVAYLTTKEGDSPKVSELRGLLKAKLPEYMVPSAFVTLDRFPLTPNGKVDRKTLPQPDFQSEPTKFVPPASVTEKVLANIWGEVLGIKQVGIHDNFFELGGHSLLATRAASRASAAFQVDLPLRMLFEHPTLTALAGQIDTLLWAREQNPKTAPCSTVALVEGSI
jgi:amino acid adenylation domain-containing protein